MKQLFNSISLCVLFGLIVFTNDLTANIISDTHEKIEHLQETTSKDPINLFGNSRISQENIYSEYIKKGFILKLNKEALRHFRKQRLSTFSLKIPTGHNSVFIELIEEPIMSADFNLRLSDDTVLNQSELGIRTYKGKLRDDPNSNVAITVQDGEIRGLITSEKGNFTLAKLRDQDAYIYYNDRDLNVKPSFECGTDTSRKSGFHQGSNNSYSNKSQNSDLIIRNYLELDYKLFTHLGSSVTNAAFYIVSLMNEGAIIFEMMDLNYILSDALIHVSPDPYFSDTTSHQIFTQWKNDIQLNFNGDIAQFLTAEKGGAYASGIGSLCGTGTYNSPHVILDKLTQLLPFPVYIRDTHVLAHETGHILGARHTHDCVWGPNDEPIDCCGHNVPPYGSNFLTGCGNSYSCSVGVPAAGGSMMSYCHLESAPGYPANPETINMAGGFHPLVRDVMLDYLTTTSCLNSAQVIGETGKLIGPAPNGASFFTKTLNNNYVNPVVVFGPLSQLDNSPANVRVTNVSSNSFDVQIDECDYLDGIHGTELAYYMVLEAGAYTLINGQMIKAGIEQVDDSWSTRSYGSYFSSTDPNPMLFTQVATNNEGGFVTTRQRNIGNFNFDIKLQEEEAADGIHAVEDVHWIAIAQGMNSGTDPFEVYPTPQNVRHQWYEFDFQQNYPNETAFLCKEQSHIGADPMMLRGNNLSSSGASIRIQEEQSANEETYHVYESMGYVVWGELGDILGNSLPPARITKAKLHSIEIEAAPKPNLKLSNLRVFPNPVSIDQILQINVLNIDQPQLITLIDINGSKVFSSHWDSRSSSLELNTSDFQPGTYILSIQHSLGVSSEKIIIVR